MFLRRKRRIDVHKCVYIAAVIAASCMFAFGLAAPAGNVHAAGMSGKVPVVTMSD